MTTTEADRIARLESEVAELRAQLDHVLGLEVIRAAVVDERDTRKQTQVRRANAAAAAAVEDRERIRERESVTADPPITIEPGSISRARLIDDVIIDGRGLWGVLQHTARTSWWQRALKAPHVKKLFDEHPDAFRARPATDREVAELLRHEATARVDRAARERARKAQAGG